MGLRVATIEDLPIILNLAMKFAKSSPYSEYVNEDKIKKIAEGFLSSEHQDKIILLYDDIGMIVGLVSPFMFGNNRVATELAWWIEPNERGKKAGKELLDAFEFWAKKVGCSIVTMMSLDDKIGKYYEKRGYKLSEMSYMKEI